MEELNIELKDLKTEYQPGQVISGTAQWNLPDQPRKISLQLLWYTRGKGDEDIGLVDSVEFENPGQFQNQDFSFTIPPGPYSFSGKLISLIWTLELLAEPRDTCYRQEITVSPGGREIVLDRVESKYGKKTFKFGKS